MKLTYGYSETTGDFVIKVLDYDDIAIKQITIPRNVARNVAKKIEYGKKGDVTVVEDYQDTNI